MSDSTKTSPRQAPASPTPARRPRQLWGGRFASSVNEKVEAFSASVHYDSRLYAEDIAGSIAHATMLAEVGVLTDSERAAIVAGLEGIAAEIERGEFDWDPQLEDVHMNIEAALTERIGEAGKKLHTGRSRNDQVATDVRLHLRKEIDSLSDLLVSLQSSLIAIAERECETVMPGFTHMQPAQPVSFGHHMLAWFEMLDRDWSRLRDCRARVDHMPLGSAALAGTSFPIRRDRTATLLGFSKICENSLDAVSDRDFAIEFVSDCALLMMHLSRMSEELIIWSTVQFRFVALGDRFCTGSSIMPQKKNPDIPELIRGKCGRVVGQLNTLLMLMKGQPLAYNRDNQEDKEPLFDCIDTVRDCLEIFTALIDDMQPDRERMQAAAIDGYTTATDLADYLVRQGVPFRDAHAVVGKAVQIAIERQCDLSELSLSELQALSSAITQEVYSVLTVTGSMQARDHFGGTAPNQVRQAASRARQRIAGRTAQA